MCTIVHTGLIRKLDERSKKKPGCRSARCVSRVHGDPVDISPPKDLPQWMVIPEYQGRSESSQPPESACPSASSTPISISCTPTSSVSHSSTSQTGSGASDYGPMYTFDIDGTYTALSDSDDSYIYTIFFKRLRAWGRGGVATNTDIDYGVCSENRKCTTVL